MVVTDLARFPGESNLLGFAFKGQVHYESDSKEPKGFSPLEGQGNKLSICEKRKPRTAACHKVVSVLMVPPQRARKVKELNKEVVC